MLNQQDEKDLDSILDAAVTMEEYRCTLQLTQNSTGSDSILNKLLRNLLTSLSLAAFLNFDYFATVSSIKNSFYYQRQKNQLGDEKSYIVLVIFL